MARSRRRKLGALAVFLAPALVLIAAPAASDPPAPPAASATIAPGLLATSGGVDVVAELDLPSVAETLAPNALRTGELPSPGSQRAAADAVARQQAEVAQRAARLGAVVIASTSRSVNALVMHVDAAAIPALAAVAGIISLEQLPALAAATDQPNYDGGQTSASSEPDSSVPSSDRSTTDSSSTTETSTTTTKTPEPSSTTPTAEPSSTTTTTESPTSGASTTTPAPEPPPTKPPPGSLAEANAYIGADVAHARGLEGTGIRIAVIDSGIDFTHFNLGGSSDPALYKTCYGTPPGPGVDEAVQPRTAPPTGPCATLFGPRAKKVIGGFDFVGETWAKAGDPLNPDPNPIDHQGHGTHVADILAGDSTDHTHQGIAPGAQLYAYKACSAITGACSSVAVLEALDAALDPDGDHDLSDAVNIINLSQGALYGQPESALVKAISNAVRAGVVVVASAGNDGDKPWIVAQPAISAGAIAVAQTALPSASLLPVHVDSPAISGLPNNTIKYAQFQPWSVTPLAPVAGNLLRPSVGTVPPNATASQGCDPSNFTGMTGAVALIDRGTCEVSVKVSNAAAAGAGAAVIVNNADGPPVSVDLGAGTPSIPAVMVSMANGRLLVDTLAQGSVHVTLDPAATITLRNTIEPTSSRGPAQDGGAVKPDIGAPGAWQSAAVGTGNGQTGFSGTSGAAPIISGAAAILLQAFPHEDPAAIKRRLIDSADTHDRTLDLNADMTRTPVTRIGAGEIHLVPALDALTQVGDPSNGDGNISLGIQDVPGQRFFMKTITISNTGTKDRTYRFSPTFLDAADAKSRAITILTPGRVTVGSGQTRDVPLVFVVNIDRLADWPYFDAASDTALAGARGNDGPGFSAAEFDGYLRINSDRGDGVHLGWQILPRKAAEVVSDMTSVALDPNGSSEIHLRNFGATPGVVDAFTLTGVSGPLPPPTTTADDARVDLAGIGVRDLSGGLLQFAITQFGRRSTPQVPAQFRIEIDTNGDSVPDAVIFNNDANNFTPVDGRNLVFVTLGTGKPTPVGATDVDFDSSNLFFTVPVSALGLHEGQTFSFSVQGIDRYFTGQVQDQVAGMSYTVGQPPFVVGSSPTFAVPPDTSDAVVTVKAAPNAGPSSQKGVLLAYRVNSGIESTQVAITGP
jgi:hypothetical protein